MSISSPEPAIDYVYDVQPEHGQSIPILPGVRWLRMPLPFLLGHINLWLLQDGDCWVIVDTGLNTRSTRELWHGVVCDQLNGADISRVVVTHLHPDHVGCAGWLTSHYQAPLWMSREEYLSCRLLLNDADQPMCSESLQFYTEAGFSQQALDRYQGTFNAFGKMISPLPLSFRRLDDGMTLQIGDHQWEVIIGRGHSVAHACLYCEELGTMISGDQVLPTISSNVSVYPTEPDGNPLADWLRSLRSLKVRLPPDTLVLPAHGQPFRGVQARLDALIQEHLDGLDALRETCREPVRAVDTFAALFNSEINAGNLVMAAGEAIAHLNFLRHRGEVKSWLDENQVRRYQLIS